MKRIIILLPVYNDWKSLQLLLKKINYQFKNKKFIIEIYIMDDGSSDQDHIQYRYLKNIRKIKIIKLKRNMGSQKAIFIGLNKIKKEKKNSIIVVMDSDGEDDPSKILILCKEAMLKKTSIIFAKRKKRLETLLFRLLNQLRLIITFLLTGKYLDFGNFSAFSNQNLKSIMKNNNISIAFCSGVVKNHKKIDLVNISKKKRFFGNSKVNNLFLVKHSINIISVFYKKVFLRTSIVFIFILLVGLVKLNYILIIFILINFLFFFFNFNEISKVIPKNYISKIINIK